MNEQLPPGALDAWAEALRERFGLGPDDIPIPLSLALASDVAAGVARRRLRSVHSSPDWWRAT